MRQQGIRWA